LRDELIWYPKMVHPRYKIFLWFEGDATLSERWKSSSCRLCVCFSWRSNTTLAHFILVSLQVTPFSDGEALEVCCVLSMDLRRQIRMGAHFTELHLQQCRVNNNLKSSLMCYKGCTEGDRFGFSWTSKRMNRRQTAKRI